MKKKILLLVVALITLPIAQSNCQTAATQLANIPISGGTMSDSGSYYLGFDIIGDITIAVSHVILDLNSHNVTGSILIEPNLSHVTIMNGYVTGTSGSNAAVCVTSCSNVKLNNLTIHQSSNYGVLMLGATDTSVTNVNVELESGATGIGIQVTNASQITINNCFVTSQFSGFDCGICMNNAGGQIQDCYVSNVQDSCYLFTNNTQNLTVLRCFAVSGERGFYFTNNTGPAISLFNCFAIKNKENGFRIDEDVDPIYLEKCMAHYNFSAFGAATNGFRLPDDKIPHLIKRCVSIGNSTGFRIEGSGKAKFTGNFSDLNSNTQYAGGIDKVNANEFVLKCEEFEFFCKKQFFQAHYWKNATRPGAIEGGC